MGEGMAKEARATETAAEKKGTVIVGITGASGVIYGVRTVSSLVKLGYKVEVIVTRGAIKVAEKECKMDLLSTLRRFNIPLYGEEEIEAPPSSSSYVVKTKGMAIAPCSIRSLAEIANGIASNLITRTALNFLRTRKRLVLLIRETPWGVIELENALKVARAGGIILPASPGFYHYPKSVDDMINFIVGKVLDMLGIKNSLYKRWDNTKSDLNPCDQIS
ncbi:UbiX family flavin prenyltransferase [Sulfolobaceae archaeon RB850M]|jgi:4-hydroxy-3-polyprenylbenzoate decarboxylase|nr:UbiX family flavin prenyltransferase [Sulfolobaceae archaeon]